MMKIRQSLVALTMFLASSQLFAHGMMEGTYPKDGAEMMEPADRIEMNFEKPMRLMKIELESSDGNTVNIDFDRSSDATTHFKTMLPQLSPDTYEVHWKAMGQDGHLMKGSFSFMQH
ncbi:copper resistance CopC family protein [Hahella ganghwensis]|uniref:copper resistance CopC family protein n=1 Tax=Hahella ganghwensis TaxID=286420 RepID=UPI001B7F887B|nr:copper resistance CopC family protein [Hahella ganghwensis]